MNLSGVMLNINASKAFVIFPNVSTSKKPGGLSKVRMSGGSEVSMSNACQQYADGKIARKDLVNSLVAYLENDSN